jgi:(p)ppGpp synthase/HD superfamily hydrolase
MGEQAWNGRSGQEITSRLIVEAELFADEKHDGQVRKYTGEPYIVHPAEVAKIVASCPEANERMIAAAWLHDVVEDTPVTLSEIDERFGSHVAMLVGFLTDASRPEDGNRAVRKRIDKAHLATAPPEAQTVKLADLISNTSSIARHDPAFARVYLAEKRELLTVLTRGNATLHAVATALAKP